MSDSFTGYIGAVPLPAAVDLSKIADNLEQGTDGIWLSRSRSAISYPDEGNLNCLSLEAGSFWFEHRNCCILETVRSHPPGGTIIDVGGGNGYVTIGLQQNGFPAALLEPGMTGVENAARRGVSALICSTLEDAGFHPASLPAAGAFDVLEHIADESLFLEEINRLLVPGGRFYLTVPAFKGLWSADDEYAGHYRRYTKESLSRSLVRAGFRVERMTYIFSILPLPIFLLRVLPSRVGVRKQQAWESYTQEHSRREGLIGWLLRKILAWELAYLRSGRIIPIGGSCLAVAIKEPVEHGNAG